LSNNIVSAILEDSNGELWIGTRNGLNKFDRINSSFRRFYPFGSYLSPSSFNIIKSLAEGDEGTLWICSDKGIIKFKKRNSEFELMPALYVNSSLMNLSTVNSVVMDKSKILWIGGYQGIFKIDTKPRKFQNYNSSPSSSPQLSNDMISAIFKDKEGIIWAGLWNNGIDLIDRKTGKVRHLSKNNPDPENRINSNNIRSIYQGSQNLLWIGTSDGIGVYDKKSRIFFSFEEYFRPVPYDLLKSRHVFTIVEDRRKDLWFGTDNGIFRYQMKINTLSEYKRIYNDSSSIDIGPIYSIVADENKIWLGTAKNGLLCFDTENNIFINHVEKLTEDFPWQTLNTIFIDSKGYMWIGTPSGLTRYDIGNNQFKHFTEKDGLANNYIYRILEDKD
jgi:ligand-binding sensor domain-containing protein